MPRDKISRIPYEEIIGTYKGTSIMISLERVNKKFHKDSNSPSIQQLMAKVLRNHMRDIYTEQGVILNYEEQLKARMSFQGF